MKILECEQISNLDLKPYTTLKIGGNAKIAYLPSDENEFISVINNHPNIPIIGAGSNLLIATNGLDSCLLTKNLKEIKQLDENRIFAYCGAKSSSFSKFVYELELEGAEFLVGIPGSIGGAVYMNAGAHGQNVKDIIESVKIFNPETNEIKELTKENIDFYYRSSTFAENNYIIISAIFNLKKGNKNKIKEKMDFHINYRAKNHPPLSEYSAGSTFRNPEGHFAANLLESIGAKEYIENNKIRFSVKHANFLYNFNNAESLDALRLIQNMWNKVKEKYNIELHPEIKFIGNKTEEEINIWQTITKQ